MDKVSKIGLAVAVLLLIGWFYWQSTQKKDISPPSPGKDVGEISAKTPSEPARRPGRPRPYRLFPRAQR